MSDRPRDDWPFDIDHADLWQVWGYPDDPDWDGKTYDIGYVTESGCGAVVASDLSLEDAHQIVGAVVNYRWMVTENHRLMQLLAAAGIDPAKSMN